MHTPQTNSPGSSGERSVSNSPGPSSYVPEIVMQVNDKLAEGGVTSELAGKKEREERQEKLAAHAENGKLLDKDWRDGLLSASLLLIEEWSKRWGDPFLERDMKPNGFEVANIASAFGKGKET